MGIGNKDIAVGMAGLIEQMKLGKNETEKVFDDGKGWVWLAADMSPGGLAVQLYTSVPYGKRPLLVAKRSEVDTMFAKVNWCSCTPRCPTGSDRFWSPSAAKSAPCLRR